MPSPTAPPRFWPIMALVVVGGAFFAGEIAGRRQASDRAAGIEKSEEIGENLRAMVAKDKPAASPRVVNWDGTGAGLLKLVHPVNAIHSRQQLLAALAGCSDGTLDELWKAWPQQGGGAAARILVSECFGREMARRHGESALDDWVVQKPASEASAWIKGVFTSLAAASPDTVVAVLERLPAQYLDGDSGLTPQRTAWLAVLSQLKPADGKAVAAAVALVKGRGDEANSVLSEWLRDEGAWVDPAGARAWALAPRNRRKNDVLGGANTSLARQDPLQAAAAWQTDPQEIFFARQNIATAIAAAWSKHDAPAALVWAQSLEGIKSPTENVRKAATEEALKELADTNPAAAAARLVGLEDVSPKVYSAVTSAWLLRDQVATKNWILGLPKQAMDWAASTYVSSGSRISLADSMDLVTKLPAGVRMDWGLENLAERAAQQDPATALTWARELPPARRKTAMQEIINVMADQDPGAALRALATLSDAEAQATVKEAGLILMQQGRFTNWAESLPLSLQGSAWAARMVWLLQNDPREAVSSALALGDKAALLRDDVASDIIPQIVTLMTDQDGAAALDWVARTFTDTTLTNTMAEAARTLASYDLESLENWIERQPNGPGKAAAEAAYKQALPEESP